ncbi:terminase small subunit protein [Phage CBW1004C-Prop1]|nr:terminase small subunit protein [Phage CBW1004C-Prop1]
MARPSKYTEATAKKICVLIAEGQSLRQISDQDGMPNKATIMRWLAANDAFCDQYAHAKERAAYLMADEILEIADDGSNDWMERVSDEGENIGWQLNGEHVQRSKLRIESRKWLMAKLLPKKYGEKQSIEHSGSIDSVSSLSDADLERIAAAGSPRTSRKKKS